jgi:hypothetical protein
MKIYTKNNFHKHTFCIFNEVLVSEIEHLTTNFVSKSGSSYLFTDEGVYRKSNHWGRAANCKWRLQTNFSTASRTKIGFAKWAEFHPINEIEKLYFIEVDLTKKSVQYQHKNNSKTENCYLRNASETAKRVKEIRNLLENDKKLQYWESDCEVEILLQKVIQYLINSDFNLLEIKNLIFSTVNTKNSLL